MRQLQEQYIAVLPDKIATIQQQWQQWLDTRDADLLKELSRNIHNLAGSAGTFGYSAMSKLSRELEKTLTSLHNKTPDSDELDVIALTLHDIEKLSHNEPDIVYQIDNKQREVAQVNTGGAPRVYVIEDEPLVADEIKTQLMHYDYQVEVFPDASTASEAMQHRLPDAFIVDVNLPEGELTGPEFVMDFVKQLDTPIPVIFMSTRDDWQARLAAVRAGGDCYYQKPLDYSEVLDRLEILIAGKQTEPYRILVVDDMPLLAEHYALVLRNSGMQAEVLTDPTLVFESIKEFDPELILMDIFMPECSGLEAAKIIRQKDELAGIPIVFLSTERDPTQQVAAMQMGADDFLQKPVSDDGLVIAVNLRVERFRKLRTLMYHDSLTGLLNHVTIKLRLEAEVMRSVRQASPLVFAMIDIDLFKQVNDQYGHQVGDRVIKNLSRLFQQRLRKSDLIGRYGGEEFAIILTDTSVDDAYIIIDNLREQFSAIVQLHGHGNFTCSFSAGLAQATANLDENQLIRLADEALYQAKKAGRNRIVCSE